MKITRGLIFEAVGASPSCKQGVSEQLDSLYIAYTRASKPGNAAEVHAAINGLCQELENPSAYSVADQFASVLRRIRPLLP